MYIFYMLKIFLNKINESFTKQEINTIEYLYCVINVIYHVFRYFETNYTCITI